MSAVSSALISNISSNLQPDPNKQSAALLRTILLTLNQSAIPGETLAVPPIEGNPPSEIVTTACLMYVNLLVSLLAAFVAMLGKRWLNTCGIQAGRCSRIAETVNRNAMGSRNGHYTS